MGKLSRGLLCSVCALCLTGATLAQSPTQLTSNLTSDDVALAELPDSPGASRAQQQNAPSEQNGATNAADQTAAQSNQAGNTQQEPQKMQRPVGTAAAEAPKVSGITAAEPSGIAIAPAKQHRVRTIVIKVGAIVGAGAALGTVIALTAATPSKPPGAH
jgi:hypothetical protein